MEKKLSSQEMVEVLSRWNDAWARHDLDGVMDLFHENVLFEHWTGGRVQGRENLRRAWSGWFQDHGGFRFEDEDTFADETTQKALYRWLLDWPCPGEGHAGKRERRRGVDVLHFEDGKIIRKLTYSKTGLEIDGERARLAYPGGAPA